MKGMEVMGPITARLRRARSVLAAVLVVAVLPVLSACGGQSAATGRPGEPLAIRYQGWVGTVMAVELAQDLGYFSSVRLDYVGSTTSGPQDIQSVATRQTDIGYAYSGAIVKLIDAGAPVTSVVTSGGSDDKTFVGYYVSEDSPIRSARDLIGKKVGVNVQGAQHQAVVETWLARQGLSAQEIATVQFVVVPPADTEQALRRHQIDAGALGGILQDHALAAGGLRALFHDIDLVGPFNAAQYVMRKDFLAQHPEASRELVTGTARAIEWLRTTPREEVIARMQRITAERNRAESVDNLQYWKSVGIATTGGAIRTEDFTLWEPWLGTQGIATPLDPARYYTNDCNDLAHAGAVPTQAAPTLGATP